MRNHLTDAEVLLWSYLRKKPYGYKFRRQHPIGIYIVDFFCHPLKLAIEADGGIHQKPEVMESDKKRENDLKEEGLYIIRFSNEDIFNRLDAVIEKINNMIVQLRMNLPAPNPLKGEKSHLRK